RKPKSTPGPRLRSPRASAATRRIPPGWASASSRWARSAKPATTSRPHAICSSRLWATWPPRWATLTRRCSKPASAWAHASSLPRRLGRAPQLVGERSEGFRSSSRALRVLAQLLPLLGGQHGFRAETDPAARRVDLQHLDRDVGAYGKRSRHVCFS